MDANFGLVRKTSSGAALTNEHVANEFFCKQSDVDRLVATVGPTNATKINVCILLCKYF